MFQNKIYEVTVNTGGFFYENITFTGVALKETEDRLTEVVIWCKANNVRWCECLEILKETLNGLSLSEALERVYEKWESTENVDYPSTEFQAFKYSAFRYINNL